MEAVEQVTPRNGRKGSNNTATDESKPKRERKMRSLAGIAEASAMTEVQITRRVDNVQTEWSAVENFSLFSLSADGSYPCVKSSKSSYIDLTRGKQENDIFSGRCYRLY